MTTWFITGASRGLGRSLATAVLDRGDNAVLGARTTDALDDLARQHPTTAMIAAVDVTDDAQVADAVRAAEDRFGRIDVLVNNAATAPPSRKAKTSRSAPSSTPTCSGPSASSKPSSRACASAEAVRS